MSRKTNQKLMSVVTLSMVFILLFVSVATGQAPAEATAPEDLPGAGWWTGIQLQNAGTGSATVQIQSYQSGSTNPAAEKSVTIAQNASTTLLPQDLNITGGFQGSSVVGANQPLNAIVNMTNRLAAGNGIAGGLAAAQYQGTSAPATELRFPLSKRNHFGKTTTFYIQNAGASAATATATFRVGATDYPYTTPSISPGRMVIINPAAAGVPSGNNVSLGALTVTSVQQLAGVVLEHGDEQPGQILQATRGFSPQDAATTLYAPIIKNEYFNRFTGLQVQNASAAPINITVTYKGGQGPCANQEYTNTATGVAAGASHTFVHLVGQAGNTMPAGCLASATVEATGNVVAIVNEAFTPSFLGGGGNGGRQEATTYSAFAGTLATVELKAPLYKENSFDKGTGLQVQNVGTSAASVVATFVGSSGTYVTNPQSIPVGGAFTFVELFKKPQLFNGTPIPSNISGSAGVFGVTVTSNEPIVAIANESTYPFNASPLQQDKNNYEAFNK